MKDERRFDLRNKMTAMVLVIFLFGVTATAQALVINFEDVDPGMRPVPMGYKGLSWGGNANNDSWIIGDE